VSELRLGFKLWFLGIAYTVRLRWVRILAAALGLAVAVSALMGVGLAATAALASFERSILPRGDLDTFVSLKKQDSAAFSVAELSLLQQHGSVSPRDELSVLVPNGSLQGAPIELPIVVFDATVLAAQDPTALLAPESVYEKLPESFLEKPTLWIQGREVSFSAVIRLRERSGLGFALYVDLGHPQLTALPRREILFSPFDKRLAIQLEQLADSLRTALKAPNLGVTRVGAERSEKAAPMLAAFSLNIAVMTGLTGLVAIALLLISGMRMAEERAHDLLVLRAFGSSRGLLAAFLAGEALLCGVLGAALAVLLGGFVISRTAESVLSTASTLFLGGRRGVIPDFYAPEVVIVTFIAALGLSLFGAVYPIYTAAFSRGAVQRSSSSNGAGSRAPLILAIVATATAIIAAKLALTLSSKVLALGCALVSVFGVAVWALVAVRFLATVSATLATHLTSHRRGFGAALFASAVVSRGATVLGRAAAVGAVALTLVVALASMVASFRGSLEDWSREVVSADVVVRALATGGSAESHPGLDPKVFSALAAIPQLRCVERTSASVQFGEFRVIGVSERCGNQTLIVGRESRASDEAIVNEAARNLLGLSEDSIIRSDSSELQFKVVGVVKDFNPSGPLVYAPLETVERVAGGSVSIVAAALYGDGLALEAVNTALRGQGLATDGATLRSVMLSTFDETFLITRFMRWCVLVLGVIAIAVLFGQWLSSSARDRGVFALLGATRIERLAAGVLGALILSAVVLLAGLIGGYAETVILVELVNPLSFGWSFPVQFSTPTLAVVSCALLICGVMLGTLGRRAELPVQRKEESLR
jgi:putative ABC transport system permease protein